MNQANIRKAEAELMSLRKCFVAARKYLFGMSGIPNYCSPECYDAKDMPRNLSTTRKGLAPKKFRLLSTSALQRSRR